MPLGTTKVDHQLFELLYSRGNYGRPYMLPPGVPPARVAALRQAFAAVFKDPAFVAEADKQKLEVDYISAEEIAGLTERIMATPRKSLRASRRCCRVAAHSKQYAILLTCCLPDLSSSY